MRTKRSIGKKMGENNEEKRKNATDQDAMPKRDKGESDSEEETQSDMSSDESEDDQGDISQNGKHQDKKGKLKEISNCKCNYKVTSNDKGLLCQRCKQWFHIGCVKVTPKKYEVLKDDNVIWSCPKCKIAFRKTAERSKEVEERCWELENENKRLRTELMAIKGEIIDETTDRVIGLVRDNLMMEIKQMVKGLLNDRNIPTLGDNDVN